MASYLVLRSFKMLQSEYFCGTSAKPFVVDEDKNIERNRLVWTDQSQIIMT